jgi:hypothetical protein
MTSRVLYALVCGWALSAGVLLPTADDKPDAKQLLQAAQENSALSKLAPYELNATVVINPGTSGPKKARLTIYREQDRSRSELQGEGYSEVQILLADHTTHISSTRSFPLREMGMLASIDRTWDKLAEIDRNQLGSVSRKKLKGEQIDCFEVQDPVKKQLCFDPVQGLLAQINPAYGDVARFLDYGSLEHAFFPRTIILTRHREQREPSAIQEVEISNIEIIKAQFAPGAFDVPEHARVIEGCDNKMIHPKMLTEPDVFGHVARQAGTWVTISISGFVEKDGTFQDVQVAVNPPYPAVAAAAAGWARRARYSAAKCGDRTVTERIDMETETLLPIGLAR